MELCYIRLQLHLRIYGWPHTDMPLHADGLTVRPSTVLKQSVAGHGGHSLQGLEVEGSEFGSRSVTDREPP